MSTHSDPVFYPGLFCDGRSAVSTPVDVRLTSEGLMMRGEGWMRPLAWAYADLAASVPLHPDSADLLVRPTANAAPTLFVAHEGFARAMLARAPHLAAMRTRLRWATPGFAVMASVLVVVAMVFALGFSPAQGVARAMPKPTREAMGRGVIASMAGQYRVCETPAGRAALDTLTRRLSQATPGLSVKVTVVNWGLVNAFATPGGQIILTRGLLQTAGSPDEVAGVLAHELGHALELHPETSFVRAIGLAAASQLIFAGSSGTATNIGLLITQIQYTRVAEQEADAHAVRILRGAGVSAKGLADFFQRIQSPAEKTVLNSSVIRTHPLTSERVAFVKSQPDYPATPSLDAAQWRALKAICGTGPTKD